jgi:alpha-1,2-mannosyltransferase
MIDPVERAAREMRNQAKVLAVVMWAVLALNWATPTLVDRISGHVKGADFVQFYSLATASRSHDFAALTSTRELQKVRARAVPQDVGDTFPAVYPPQVGLALQPLAFFPYPVALALWTLLTWILYGTATWLLWKHCPRLRSYGRTVAWLACAFPAFWWLVANGHLSAVALGALALAYLALEQKRSWLAGCAIGLLAYKWTLLLPAVAVCLLAGEVTMLLGAAAVTAGQLGLAVPFVGLDGVRQHFVTMIQLSRTPDLVAVKPYLMFSLRTFWATLVPGRLAVVLSVASALYVLFVAARAWRHTPSALGRIGFMACAVVLATPHCFAYDLVVLVPAILLAADTALALPRGSPARAMLTRTSYAVFFAMMFSLAASVVRIQLATPLLLFWLILLTRSARLR